MPNTHPKVSIGLPVYNGEWYISEAIQSLLAQTFHDFEIIICDNASTDGTQGICRSFVRLDKRIHYYRNSENAGAAANFNRTFELASGVYFKWAAHDDLIAPDFLRKCVEVLDKDNSVVLCHSEVQFIDECGKHIPNPDTVLIKADSQELPVRFAEIASMHHWNLEIFGLIRSEILRQTPLIASYVGSDRNTMMALGLRGRLYRVPECLFFSRDHSERSMQKIPLHYRTAWFDPKKGNKIAFPHWRIFLEYFKSLNRIKIPVRQRAACHLHLLRWLKQNNKRMKKDLRIGKRYITEHIAVRYFKHLKKFCKKK